MGVRDTIAKAVMGIKAYHSSPHDFDKFDLKKIGTGEGAQAYGHGLYFAENPAVSGQGGQYWNQFVPRFEGAEGSAAKLLQRNSFDREAAIANAKREVDQFWNTYENSLQGGDKKYTKVFDNMERQLRLLESGAPVGPRTYEVNIKADPAQMLDWDKSMAAQSPMARNAIGSAYKKLGVEVGDPFLQAPDLFGRDAYESIGRTAAPGSGSRIGSPIASQHLSEAGIPGIKYLDEGSRGIQRPTVVPTNTAFGNVPMLETIPSPKQTHNYVVFDPDKIDILKKYGVVGAPAGALGATYDQSQYEVQP